MEAMTCSNISKKYGDKEVLKNINLTIEKGKIYGMIGRNGAGKTTLLSILASQNPATTGEVICDGEKVWENRKALNHICFSRELSQNQNGTGVAGLSIRDYLRAASYYYPNWDKAMEEELLEKFGLRKKDKIAKVSKGMLSMVTIIVAMASKAEYTFLDEPVAGLDVVMREYFYRRLLDEYMQTGRTFVISTHIIEEAADIFEEVIIVKDGEILLKENTQSLVGRAYRISGLNEAVGRATAGLETYRAEHMGRSMGVTVFLKEGEIFPEGYDISIQPVNLQSAFVALCGME